MGQGESRSNKGLGFRKKSFASSGITLEEFEKLNKRRAEIVGEILHSESSYVRYLEEFLTIFINPLMKCSLLKPKDMQRLFSLQYIEVLLNFHKKFLQKLSSRIDNGKWSDKQSIGDVFISHGEALKMYTTYINGYGDATATIVKLREKEPSFAQILEECKKSRPPDFKQLGLFDYMIMPVQRLPRYELLLNNLLRNTWEGHADYASVESALLTIRSVNTYINQEQKYAENMNRFLEWQSANLRGPYIHIATASRKLLKEGSLYVLAINKEEEAQTNSKMVDSSSTEKNRGFTLTWSSMSSSKNSPMTIRSPHKCSPSTSFFIDNSSNSNDSTNNANKNKDEFHYFLFNDLLLIVSPERTFFKSFAGWKVEEMVSLTEISVRDVSCASPCEKDKNSSSIKKSSFSLLQGISTSSKSVVQFSLEISTKREKLLLCFMNALEKDSWLKEFCVLRDQLISLQKTGKRFKFPKIRFLGNFTSFGGVKSKDSPTGSESQAISSTSTTTTTTTTTTNTTNFTSSSNSSVH